MSLKEKIVFLTSKKYPGVTSLGKHGKRIGLWDLKFVEDTPTVSPDILIIGGFCKVQRKRTRYKVGYFFCSPPMLVEESGEFELKALRTIEKLRRRKIIDFVLFSDESLAEVYDGIYVPNPIDTSIETKKHKKIDGIGLFFPPRLQKNIFTQLLAVKLFQKKYDISLYTNLGPYEKVMKNLKINYKLFEWLPEEKYFDLLSKMKFCLNCSWSESMSYYAVDSLLQNTVSVVSPTISWYPFKNLVVRDISKPLEILKKMEFCLNYTKDENYKKVIDLWKKKVKRENEKIEKIIKKL